MPDKVEITKKRIEEIFSSYPPDERMQDRIILEIQDSYADGFHDGMAERDKMIRKFLDGETV